MLTLVSKSRLIKITMKSLFDMPNRPKKVNRPWQSPRKPFGRRAKSHYDFYNSTRWRKKSKRYRDKHPYCVHCEKEGIVSAADVVDHIQGLGYLLENSLDPYDDKELQGLCHHHHNRKSGRQAHGLK